MAELVAKGYIAQAEYDTAEAASRQAEAQADSVRAAIGKKTIRAPFAGRLGIRLINLGQMLREGEAIVSIQLLEPILVNFTLPQRDLGLLTPGMQVQLRTEAVDQAPFDGSIVAIHPEIDPLTRNVRVQARVANREERLRPGMFVKVAVLLPLSKKVLVIPATAVLPAPYGDSVFVIEQGRKDAKSDEKPVAGTALRQQFVRLGERRGDLVSILSGLKEGATVAATGVFKLRNGQAVVIDNRLLPKFSPAPSPENS